MGRRSYSGLTYVVLGSFLWGVAAVFSKVGVTLVGPWTAVFVRSLVFGSIVLGYVLVRGEVEWDGTTPITYATLAGLTMGIGIISVRFAYSLFEVSTVVPLQRLSVLVTVLFGVLLLEESMTTRKLSGIGCAMIAFFLLAP